MNSKRPPTPPVPERTVRERLLQRWPQDTAKLRTVATRLGKHMNLAPWMYGQGPNGVDNPANREKVEKRWRDMIKTGNMAGLTKQDLKVKPAWVGAQSARYTIMLEAHYRYYLNQGQIDRATAVLAQLFKMSIVVATRYWQMQHRQGNIKVIPEETEEGEVIEDVASMTDEQLLEGMKEPIDESPEEDE